MVRCALFLSASLSRALQCFRINVCACVFACAQQNTQKSSTRAHSSTAESGKGVLCHLSFGAGAAADIFRCARAAIAVNYALFRFRTMAHNCVILRGKRTEQTRRQGCSVQITTSLSALLSGSSLQRSHLTSERFCQRL